MAPNVQKSVRTACMSLPETPLCIAPLLVGLAALRRASTHEKKEPFLLCPRSGSFPPQPLVIGLTYSLLGKVVQDVYVEEEKREREEREREKERVWSLTVSSSDEWFALIKRREGGERESDQPTLTPSSSPSSSSPPPSPRVWKRRRPSFLPSFLPPPYK